MEQCKTEYNEFIQSLGKQTDKIAHDKRQGDERLHQLADMIERNTHSLQEMSVNRAESERLEAQENQIKADEYTCETEVRTTLGKYQTHIISALSSSTSSSSATLPVIQNHMQLEELWTSLQRYLTHTKSTVSTARDNYAKIKEEGTRARAIYNQDVRKKQEIERMIEKKFSGCEQQLRDCMAALGKLMRDDEGEEVQPSCFVNWAVVMRFSVLCLTISHIVMPVHYLFSNRFDFLSTIILSPNIYFPVL